MGVTIEEVKAYNEKLKSCKEQRLKLETELEVGKKELSRLCHEISEQLGKEVNEENIAQVYTDYMAQLERKVRNGNEILDRVFKQQDGGFGL